MKATVHCNGIKIKKLIVKYVCRLYFRSVQSFYLCAAKQELKIYLQKEASASASQFPLKVKKIMHEKYVAQY